MRAIKERTVIQPGGILHIQRHDLPEGATVEVVVTIESPLPVPAPLTGFWGIAKGAYGPTPEDAQAYIDQERSAWD